jgi:dTDP-4-amino-4,6-dideoxy-D-galactose acyltransferase
MTEPDLVEFLAWDTEFWGVRAARVHVDNEDDLGRADVQSAELDIRWASLLAPSANCSLVNAALRRGYELVDVRVTLARALDASSGPAAVDLAEEVDADQMAEIAATAFPESRFFVDPHLDGARCRLFYETWVRNSLNRQMADAIVVSRHEGEVDGFIALRVRPEHTGSLSLVAIRADRRGRGIGGRLSTDALGWLAAQGATSVEVVTQLANTQALRLYESVGFQTVEAGFWLHRWY